MKLIKLSLLLLFSISNYSCLSPNNIVLVNPDDIIFKTNISDLSTEKVEKITLDNEEISNSKYNVNSGEITLPNLEKGKHILKLKFQGNDELEIPLEIKNDNSKRFKFNVSLEENKISSWEVGSDNDNDGLIDKDTYFSKGYSSYVIFRDSNGSLIQLDKNSLSEDFKEFSSLKNPENFTFPELNENEFNSENGIKIFDTIDRTDPNKDTVEGLTDLDSPFAGNYILELPNYSELNGFWIKAITDSKNLMPYNRYLVRKNYLIMDKHRFKNKPLLNIYLTNSNEEGYLLELKSLRSWEPMKNNQESTYSIKQGQPVLRDSGRRPPPPSGSNSGNQLPPPPSGSNSGNQLPPPPSGSNSGNQLPPPSSDSNSSNQLPPPLEPERSFEERLKFIPELSNIPELNSSKLGVNIPQLPSDGVIRNTIVSPDYIDFNLKKGINFDDNIFSGLSSESFKKPIMSVNNKVVALRVSSTGEYALIDSSGSIITVVSELEAKSNKNYIILESNN